MHMPRSSVSFLTAVGIPFSGRSCFLIRPQLLTSFYPLPLGKDIARLHPPPRLEDGFIAAGDVSEHKK